jgi:hypothetical protein
MKNNVQLQPGDIFLTRGQGWLSKAIRRFTTTFGESRSKVNHVGIITTEGDLSTAAAVEALHTVKRHTLMEEYGGTNQEVAIYRPVNLTPAELEAIVKRAEGYVGQSYGYLKIFTHLMDWCLCGAYLFRRLTASDRYPICSWLVAHAYLAAGKDFGVDAGAASPDDIWDFVTHRGHRRYYRCVRRLSKLS